VVYNHEILCYPRYPRKKWKYFRRSNL
jgi:hypothetical protein